MMNRTLAFILLSLFVAAAGHAYGPSGQAAYYLGEQVCRDCHSSLDPDNPWSKWRLSKHSTAYASLATPEAWKIAEISGVDIDPQKSPVCLGCHATASMAEAWELNPEFSRKDGVQCEACHGPASNYLDVHQERNREKSMAAGMMFPGEQDCLVCHIEKGTHVAVLEAGKYVHDMFWAEIAHRSEGSRKERIERPEPAERTRPHYVGSDSCGSCHDGPDMGYQWSLWREGIHSRAFAVLGTNAARDIADRVGVKDDPQTAPQCLECHTTAPTATAEEMGADFSNTEGVGCEACHGAGSEYSPEAIMRDALAARAAGLVTPGPDSCMRCHDSSRDIHIKPFNYAERWPAIAHPREVVRKAQAETYKTPMNLALSKDGKTLYAACEASNSVLIVDTVTRRVTGEVAIGNQPNDICLSPDETRIYVTNRGTDSLSVVDTRSREVIGTVTVGDEPHGVLTDAIGSTVYVVNAGTNDVSIIDAETLEPRHRFTAGRAAWSLDRSPDGKHLLVSSALPHFSEFRQPSDNEVTRFDIESGRVDHRYLLSGVNLIQGIAWSPDGEFALCTMLRTKNLVPMTRIDQNWVVSNALGILWKDGTHDQVLLDEPMDGFADATDVTFLPNGKYAYVTGAGVDAVAVVDIPALLRLVKGSTPEERESVLPIHLGYAPQFVVKRIPVGQAPRGIVASRDSRWVYVANALEDTISVIDARKQEVVDVIDLGGPKTLTTARFGEQVFHSAFKTFQNQFSCHTCHPDGGVDALTYSIEPEGVGVNPVDNRTLRGILDTAPFKWSGKNPSLSRQCGPRLAVFFTRIDPFTPEQLAALDYYITTIPRNPNYHRPLGQDLTDAQRRGREIFFRTVDNFKRPIPREQQCHFCHSGPYYTNRQLFDVGSITPLGTHGLFDVPHLNNIYETAPYLHAGQARSLEEIWTTYDPHGRHGQTNDMTKDELNDLVEFLKTL